MNNNNQLYDDKTSNTNNVDPLTFLDNSSNQNKIITNSKSNLSVNSFFEEKSKIIILVLIILAITLITSSFMFMNNDSKNISNSNIQAKEIVKSLKPTDGKLEYIYLVKEKDNLPSNLKIGSYVNISISYNNSGKQTNKTFIENAKILNIRNKEEKTINPSKSKDKINSIILELDQEPYDLLTKIPTDNEYNIEISLTKSKSQKVSKDLEGIIVSEDIKELLNSIINPIEPLSPREGLYEYNLSKSLISSGTTSLKIGDYINVVAISIKDGTSTPIVLNTRILNFKDINGIKSNNNSATTIVIEVDYQIYHILDRTPFANLITLGLEKIEDTPYNLPTLGNDENMLLYIEMAGQ